MILGYLIKARVWRLGSTLFTGEYNVLVRNRWRIAMNYFRGWAVIDIVSLIPFDVIYVLSDADDGSEFASGAEALRAGMGAEAFASARGDGATPPPARATSAMKLRPALLPSPFSLSQKARRPRAARARGTRPPRARPRTTPRSRRAASRRRAPTAPSGCGTRARAPFPSHDGSRG